MSSCSEPRNNLFFSPDPVKDAALGRLLSNLDALKDEVQLDQAVLKKQNGSLVLGNQKQLFLTDELAKFRGAVYGRRA